jgi:hypothetical protein
MKQLAVLLVLLLCMPFAEAKVFYYADEIDYANNVGFALAHSFDGIDPERSGNLDKYACMSLDDYNHYAASHQYQARTAFTAGSISPEDLKRLDRADQLRIADENPFDSITRDTFTDEDYWDCYRLRSYNSLARENLFDDRNVVDFTSFDHLNQVKKIGKYRYNDFFTFPDDFASFDLQRTVPRLPYYEPYDYRPTPYPLYGFGIWLRQAS